MCRSPSMPALPAPPPPAQPLQTPQKATGQANRNPNMVGGGTLLTGPSGIANVQTARTTLLGQ